MSWSSSDIPWEQFRPDLLEHDVVRLMAAAALVEENAPSYGRYLHSVFKADPAFCSAIDRWVAEEEQHGQVLCRWSRLADPGFDSTAALARFAATITSPEDASVSVRGSRLGELVARCTVEIGTHTFYSAIADSCREPVLRAICRRIASDEARHYRMFLNHAQRYRARFSQFRLLLTALGRMRDTGDDELAFAWHAGGGSRRYCRRRDSSSFHLATFRRYRKRHVERASSLLAQAIGFFPNGWMSRLFGIIGWRMIGRRVRSLATAV